MPNIKSKRSAVPGRVPTVDQLELGELALNTYDGRLFLKKSVNGVESVVTLKAQENAALARLIAGNGLQNATYDGGSDVVFNVDPSEININSLSGVSDFISTQLGDSGSIIGALTGGNSIASFAITGSNLFKGHEVLSGSVLIKPSLDTTFNITLIDTANPATPTPTPTAKPSPTPTATLLSGLPTRTPTPTVGPTLTPTPTPTNGPVVPQIYLGSPSCRQNNCNDGGYCGVKFDISVFNAPFGAYVDAIKTGGGGYISVLNNTDMNNVKLVRTETDSTDMATSVTLYLRASNGSQLATYSGTITRSSWWATLPLCT